ncbi:MAG: ABC transporter ATP-binding protein [Actinomycetota bacterium]|uniref:ABC transporter ATP-binding protein n=1 Tax=Arthrobacter sp. A5 TaxID=576926 RepID=UPI0027F2E79B|nr:ABC transporter ATP-binding protein [Actinomycetota bacterium]
MLELDDAGFSYGGRGRARSGSGAGGRDWVFRNVSFRVSAGSATAILGPNGSGKTTLARCAAGLLAPSEGTVLRDDTVGYVPQAHGSAFAYRALDMVLMGRARQIRVFRSPGTADTRAAHEAMERVGIGVLAERLFPTLSGGEQQLVLIARAIAAGSPTLVLDEPSTGLDLKNQIQVLRLLSALVADGMALLLSSHDPDHALFLADSVVLMDKNTVRTGTAEALLNARELSTLYGVSVSTIDYNEENGAGRRTVVAHYETPVGKSRSRDR